MQLYLVKSMYTTVCNVWHALTMSSMTSAIGTECRV